MEEAAGVVLRGKLFLSTMNTDEPPLPTQEAGVTKRPALRPWFLMTVLGLAALIAALMGWLVWASGPQISLYDLSRADGRSRFYATTYPETETPPNLSLLDRLFWSWNQFQRRHGKRNLVIYSFPPTPVRLCSLSGLLTQCMEVTGTKYLIAVEIAGSVEFGHTNTLNGTQWVAAFEHALTTSYPIICYDYAGKRNFQDTLLLIRERPGVIKVVPRTKLVDYQKAGLVKGGSQ